MKALDQRNLKMSMILPLGTHQPHPGGKCTPLGQILIIPAEVHQYGYQMTALGQRNLKMNVCSHACMNGCIKPLCQFDSGLVPLPLDVCFLAFYYIFFELHEFELVFRNFF